MHISHRSHLLQIFPTFAPTSKFLQYRSSAPSPFLHFCNLDYCAVVCSISGFQLLKIFPSTLVNLISIDAVLDGDQCFQFGVNAGYHIYTVARLHILVRVTQAYFVQTVFGFMEEIFGFPVDSHLCSTEIYHRLGGLCASHKRTKISVF